MGARRCSALVAPGYKTAIGPPGKFDRPFAWQHEATKQRALTSKQHKTSPARGPRLFLTVMEPLRSAGAPSGYIKPI